MALIASATLQNEEVQVYYAPRQPVSADSDHEDSVNATKFYSGFFKGDIAKSSIIQDINMLSHHIKTAVHWTNLRNTDQNPDPKCLGVSCSGNGICFEGEFLCIHGWKGSKCDTDPCENYISIVPSEKYCGQCKVTFNLNSSTIFPHPISSVMVSGSFSNWTAVDMHLDEYDILIEDAAYSKLYPEGIFYRGFSSAHSYLVDLHIPNGQNHTYKYVLDQALWSFDKCNPDAVSDGMESMQLNSFLHVSCAS